MDESKLTYVDLFAGGGGLSVGLENAGYGLVHAVEVDEDARETFAANRNSVSKADLTGDIRDVESDDITEEVGSESVDLVAGGPPCQGFSEVVSPDGSDERNHLFTHFIDWVDKLSPKAALFENVRGMENTADGKFLDAVKKSFNNIGYNVTTRIVTSSDFGVPQHRRRLVVLAYERPQLTHPLEGFELDPVETPSVMDGIGDLPKVAPGTEVTEYGQTPETVLQEDLRGDSETLTEHEAAGHSEEMVEMISHIPDGGNRTAIPDELQPSSGYHNSYSRLDSTEPAVAITSNMSKPSSARCIHPFEDRGLTPREGARLQTFPDEYEFHGGLVARRQQIGNAVPPYLAEALGYYLKQAVFDVELDESNHERIRLMRSGAMAPSEFRNKKGEISGPKQQATFGKIR
jgi:DNA (cytosine-5)-methyltransferase 1